VEPFKAFGAEVEFYGVDRNCKPDFTEIESKIKPATAAILAVHYFGFPQEIQRFREICTRHGIALIEDCAHVLAGEIDSRAMGSWGDASVFSFRKFLPTYDGAELRVNKPSAGLEIPRSRERILFTAKIAKSLLDRTLEQSSGNAARGISLGLESAKKIWRKVSRTPPEQPLVSLDGNQASFDVSLLNQPFSRTSLWLFNHSDISGIVQKRRENYLVLQRELKTIEGVQPVHADLPDKVCPWVFPVFFDSSPNALLSLRNQGVPAATWGFVRPQLLARNCFAEADFLYENLVFLPIHQNLRWNHLEKIIASVAKVAASRAGRPSKLGCSAG